MLGQEVGRFLTVTRSPVFKPALKSYIPYQTRGGRRPNETGPSPALESLELNSFLIVTGKSEVMLGTLLCVFGSSEGHSELTEEMKAIPNLQKS